MAKDWQAAEQGRRALGAQLATRRQAAGYTQAALASLTGYSRSTVANVETGRQHAPADFWQHADTSLRAGGALITASDEAEAAIRAGQAAAQAARTALRARTRDHNGAASPAAIAVPGRALSLPGGEMADHLELIELARRSEASDLGAGTLDALWAAIDALCRAYPAAPAPALRQDALPYLRYVLGLLDGRVTVAQHRDLLVQAGWLAALLACACYDAGAAAQARTACQLTRQLAGQAGHGELAGWSYEIAAWFALVEGRYGDTVALSQAGAAHAGQTSAGVQCALQAARGYARMRDDRARAAVTTGRQLLDRLPETGNPQHHFVFDRAKYEFYAATIYTWLGSDDAAAHEHATWVTSQCQGPAGIRWPMRYADSQINLALVAARRRDLDEAVTRGKAALAPERRSAQLLPRAVELRQHLTAAYPAERLTAEYSDVLAGEITKDAARLGEIAASRAPAAR